MKKLFFIILIFFALSSQSFAQKILFPLKATHTFVDGSSFLSNYYTDPFDVTNYATAVFFIKLIDNNGHDVNLQVLVQSKDPYSGNWITITRSRPVRGNGGKYFLFVEAALGNNIRLYCDTGGYSLKFSITGVFKSKVMLK